MDHEENKSQSQSHEDLVSPEPLLGADSTPAQARRRVHKKRPPKPRKGGSSILAIIFGILLFFSAIGNVILFTILIVVASIASTTHSGGGDYVENVIRHGSKSQKIAVIRLYGVIDVEQSMEIERQLKAAAEDHNVRALIIRTVSPGGSVSGSDQIHHNILKYREETGNPVVAFMQTVAASGGYYTSVACDKIIAEPTVITGSIGVIASHMSVTELFKDKLGIQPMIIRSGPKKAWPSMFDELDESQRTYLMDKLINPSYERFVDLVAEGRPELSRGEVLTLADGSIYFADEAAEKKLVDQIGFMDEAIALTEELAGISDAHVIEYGRQFSFAQLLESEQKSLLNLDKNSLREFLGTELLYLWEGYTP